MPGLLRTIGNAVRKLDMFPSSQFLRYKTQPKYKTATGGIISILILAVFIALFASTAVKTLNREIVIATERAEKQANPVPSSLTFHPNDGFMFALGISAGQNTGILDLSGQSFRYFDVKLELWEKQTDLSYTNRELPLTQCTKQHFSRAPEISQSYSDAILSSMVCPSWNGSSYTIEGGINSFKNSFIQLEISRCNSTKHSNCISDEELLSLEAVSGNFQALILLISNTVSPDFQNYKQTDVDSRRLFGFTLSDGVQTDIYLQEAIVQTDNSLTPISQVEVEKVLTVEDFVLSRPTNGLFSSFMSVRFAKSPIQRTYYRSFQQIDTFFSYVGGLIGTIIGLLFIIQFYSRYAYSISIASQLYLSESGDKISSNSFHFGYFFLIPLKRLLNFLCCCPVSWARTDFYIRCIDEANQQLDVLTLMKKIILIEKAISLLFKDHQLEALFLFQKQHIDQAEKNRKKHELRQKLYAGSKVTPTSQQDNHCHQQEVMPEVNLVLQNSEAFKTDEQLSRSSLSSVDFQSRKRLERQMSVLIRQSHQGNQVSSSIVKGISRCVFANIRPEIQKHQEQIKQPPQLNQRLKLKRRKLLDPIPERAAGDAIRSRVSSELQQDKNQS